jgi:ABC-type multidrug transport system fused ATPase/permease subunit
VLEQGGVVERGTHGELMAMDRGRYRRCTTGSTRSSATRS